MKTDIETINKAINDFIKGNFEKKSDQEMAKILGVTVAKIRYRREKLGLKRPEHNREEMEEIYKRLLSYQKK